MTPPDEVRIPLAQPDRFFVVRRSAVTLDSDVVTAGVYRINTTPAGEFRRLISSQLTLLAGDGDALLGTLAEWARP